MRRVFKKAPLALIVFVGFLFSASTALADTPTFQFAFGSFANPNGIAVAEATGDVYVADLGSSTVSQSVSKFDSAGALIESWGTKGTLDGSTTSAGPFAFPATEPGTPAAIAVDNSTNASDPSQGDLYVMDVGHNVIDKFDSNGQYLSQITGPSFGALLGVGIDADGDVHVDVGAPSPGVEVFDQSTVNGFVRTISGGEGVPGYGFATGGQGAADYLLSSCGCVEKLTMGGLGYGPVDTGATAVAAAVDPTNGHLYIDDQSSVSEWDSGEMNGNTKVKILEHGRFLSSFGVLTESPAKQGGIAVNGASGKVYVSSPVDGNVDVFAGTTPAGAVAVPASVTQTTATLQGTVDPRGLPVASCEFRYGASGTLDLTLPLAVLSQSTECVDEHGEAITGATSPVAVHANVSGLSPGTLYHFRLVVGNVTGSSPSGGLFPTASAGFGIKAFEVAFLNRDGIPDVQAGSHPFEMLTSMAFNTQVVGDQIHQRYKYLPVGNFKDLRFHFPPGFVGDPNATTKQCTLNELIPLAEPFTAECPAESTVGLLEPEYLGPVNEQPATGATSGVWVMVPPPGVALQFGSHPIKPAAFVDAGVPAGGDSGAVATVEGAPVTSPVYAFRQTLFGGAPLRSTRPLLTMPTACNGPLTSTVEVDSYQNPGHFVKASSVSRDAAGAPAGMSGCAQLAFPPTIKAKPDIPNASSSSGLVAGVHVSQEAAQNPEGLAESALRDTTVALPAGVGVNPAGGGGLEGCSEGLAGFTGFTEFNPSFEPGDETATFTPDSPESLQPGVSFCPNASKVGTAKIKLPILPDPLEGAVYLASQNANPFGSLLAMYMVIEDPVSGSVGKVVFHVQLCQSAGEVIGGLSCEAQGQIITTSHNSPQIPFEDLELHFFGGERAPLSTPAHCGTYTTRALFTPWDGNGPVEASSSFQIEHGPNGGPCPGPRLPFNPTFAGGSTNIQAGAFTPLTGTFSREDGEQQLSRLQFTLPPGLSGLLTGVKLCDEADANAGTCGPESEIGETTVSAGVGSDPVTVTGGKVYLTEKYHGAPFGLSVVDPVKAGPFDLERDSANPNQNPPCDCVVVRAKIEVDPVTAALTITSNSESEGFAIPHLIDGIPVQIKKVNFIVNRNEFQFNPTNCSKMAIAGTVESDEGESRGVEVPFQATNCATLAFKPQFSVSVTGKTSKTQGAGLTAKVSYPPGSIGSQANIKSVKVELPVQLPSRLTTLQKACLAATFNANPASCPPRSVVGHAKVITPILPVPLEGPAYFVSHGGEEFPNLTIVLQGYGVTVDLVGTTFISKKGITSTTFKATPDVPFNSFELTLPQGPYSALAANTNLCSATKLVPVKKRVTVRVHGRKRSVTRKVKRRVAATLAMPTEFTGQNGAQLKQNTKIAVTGCPKAKKAKKHTTFKGKRKKR